MSSELERRLEGLLAEAPEPDTGAGEEALHRALRSLQPVAPARRGLRTAVLAFAAAAVLLALAAGSLAAAGALHVSFGAKKKPPHPVATQLTLPKGANGFAAIVNGRLSVVIRGLRLQGLRATATTLSPHALNVAAGIGRSLVALKPSGRQVWSHFTNGRVVAISWRPDGLEIAYIVQKGHRFALHTIYGNGKRGTDTVIDRSVRPVRPSWRSDSLALAYVGAGGKAIVYDLGHRRRRVITSRSPVTRVAFAPTGRTLAFATPGAAVVAGKTVATGDIEALGWRPDSRLEVAQEMGVTPAIVVRLTRSGRPLGSFRVPGRVVAITGGYVITRRTDKIVAGWRAAGARILLRVSPATSVDDLELG